MSQVTRDGTSQKASSSDACPDESDLFLLLDGELEPEAQIRLLRHLSSCESCREAGLDALRAAGRASGFVFRTVLEAGWGPA